VCSSLWWCVVHHALFAVCHGGVSFVVVRCGGAVVVVIRSVTIHS
jgi:hypothetical protein